MEHIPLRIPGLHLDPITLLTFLCGLSLACWGRLEELRLQNQWPGVSLLPKAIVDICGKPPFL